ncbi:hypothetical protein [Pricia sp.]|uniref:hypothetical protein n=1 Tax=Pricia sp. TaxID=2268138 RepID=UPI0035938964
MADNKPVNSRPDSDEIDLGQLFRMIGRGFNSLFRGFLTIYLYFKTNFWKLAILVFIGLAIGYGLKFLISDKLKTEVIVMPNFDSKDYLYNVVEEIDANLKSKDTVFFKELGIVISELKSLEIEIEPIKEEIEEVDREENLKYLEVLQNFQDDTFIADVVKTEILKKSGINHRITFYYKNDLAGREATRRLMEYINDNEFFNELQQIYNQNALVKIERNQELIRQIDALIDGYTKNISRGKSIDQGTVVLENEKSLEVPSLLSLKNKLVKEIERAKLEIAEQKHTIRIINFGKNQKVKVPVYSQGILVIPFILVFIFVMGTFFKYLNKKSKEL